PALGTLGLCANIVNTVVFYKMGLTDGVSQNFFILSISDGCLTALSLISSGAYILYTEVFVDGRSAHHVAQVVYYVALLIGTFPQSVSMFTTVVIAVVRCLCVAIPLRVKFLMTARRQLAVILMFSSCTTCVVLYSFIPGRALLVHNPVTDTYFTMIVDLKWFEYTVYASATSYIGFITVIICVIIITISLNRSTNFREKTTSPASSLSAGEQNKDGSREARVIKTVVFVSVVFILCNLPAMAHTLIGTLVKEFSSDGVYRNENSLNMIVMEMFIVINATVNIFIYYFCNMRYRTTFITVF
ncbi:hypothetical protein EGW08_021378, partial [Elysia chlorotica]